VGIESNVEVSSSVTQSSVGNGSTSATLPEAPPIDDLRHLELTKWKTVRYNEDTSKFEFFYDNTQMIPYTDRQFQFFIENNWFKVGRTSSKNSLKFVKEQNGAMVTRSIEKARGGATRSQCVAQGIIVTTMKDMDDGADNVPLLQLSKPYLQMEGVGYCVLISAYNLHPTMTSEDVAFFKMLHKLEENGGGGVWVIEPTKLLQLIHNRCTDYYFKAKLDKKNDCKQRTARIKQVITEASRENGKLLLELSLKTLTLMTTLNVRHFVAYDASRNIIIEPSQRGGLEIIRNEDNYPEILETLKYTDTYDIVGVYELNIKQPRR
jgi:hypothetical protein